MEALGRTSAKTWGKAVLIEIGAAKLQTSTYCHTEDVTGKPLLTEAKSLNLTPLKTGPANITGGGWEEEQRILYNGIKVIRKSTSKGWTITSYFVKRNCIVEVLLNDGWSVGAQIGGFHNFSQNCHFRVHLGQGRVLKLNATENSV